VESGWNSGRLKREDADAKNLPPLGYPVLIGNKKALEKSRA
jgi:hypothetical protein